MKSFHEDRSERTTCVSLTGTLAATHLSDRGTHGKQSQMYLQCWSGRSSTPNVEGLPDLADLPDLVIPDVDSCTGNDTVLYTIY